MESEKLHTNKLLDVDKSLEHESSAETISLGEDTLVILDMDRTLINSGQLVNLTLLSIEDSLNSASGDDEATKQAIAALERVRQQQKQQVGNSFAYLQALQKEMGDSAVNTAEGLAKQVLDANRDGEGRLKQSFINQVMLSGAIELLDEIGRQGSDWLIQTAGEDLTQSYKLHLVQAICDEHRPGAPSLSYLVTDPDHHLSKAEMIDQSRLVGRDGQPRFDVALLSKHSHIASVSQRIAGAQYSKVVLLDDKPANLRYQDGATIKPSITTVLVKADGEPDRDGQLLSDIQKRFQ